METLEQSYRLARQNEHIADAIRVFYSLPAIYQDYPDVYVEKAKLWWRLSFESNEPEVFEALCNELSIGIKPGAAAEEIVADHILELLAHAIQVDPECLDAIEEMIDSSVSLFKANLGDQSFQTLLNQYLDLAKPDMHFLQQCLQEFDSSVLSVTQVEDLLDA